MNKNITLIGVAAIAIIGLSWWGLSSGGTSSTGNNQSQQANSVAAGNTTGAQLAPDFTLSKLGGGTITLSDYKGKKPVVLDFWTTWCPNCRRDIPHLNSFYQKYKDQVEVIGINLQENPQLVQQTIASRGIVYPIALDPSAEATRAYGVNYTNVHVLIDKDGKLVKVIPGDIQESDFTQLIGG